MEAGPVVGVPGCAGQTVQLGVVSAPEGGQAEPGGGGGTEVQGRHWHSKVRIHQASPTHLNLARTWTGAGARCQLNIGSCLLEPHGSPMELTENCPEESNDALQSYL